MIACQKPSGSWICGECPHCGSSTSDGAGNAGGKFVGEGRRRRRVAQADHDQRGIADRAELGAAIEPGERAASRGEVFRPGGAQARLALLGDLRMRGKEIVGKHSLQRRRENGFHAAAFDPFGHGVEGAFALRRDGGAGVDQDQPVEQPAVPDRQFHRDEAAEAVAQQVGIAGQAELRQLLGDAVGHLFEVRVRPAPRRRIRAD